MTTPNPIAMTDLSGRVAIVTGGSRGQGEAEARLLARAGAAVLIADVLDAEGTALAEALVADGHEARFAHLDVASPESWTAAIDLVQAWKGRLDVLVNNAGITRDTTMRRMDHQKWQDVIDTNLGGCFNMAKAVFDGMTSRGYGRIVNIGSINGQAGQYGQVNYAAAKSGIHGFTKALAQEGAKFGVTVNAIAPGYIDTDMVAAVPDEVLQKIVARIPVGRLGRADEIARGVAFLCDENGGFVTGSTLSINGGQHMY